MTGFRFASLDLRTVQAGRLFPITVRSLLTVLIALGFLLLTTNASLAQQDAQPSPLSARLDALADAYMTTEQVPGAIAAIVSGDEVILRGYGFADVATGTPVDPAGTRFEIGSISKLFTWIAVMMLVEEGRLDLQADVSSYLRTARVPGDDPLTLAQLMSHRPGYEESYGIFDPEIASLPRPQALAASAPEQVFPRGEVTSYSNWGVALAGQIVEDVSGQPWAAFVQARVLDPLGMDNTTTSEAARGPGQPPLSRSYRVQGGLAHPAFRIDIGAFAPAGGIASTADDMAQFLRFLTGDGALNGVRLLQPETMARMHTRLFDDRPQAADIAHGLQARPMFGTTILGHGGGLNEFVSNLVFLPEIGAGVFISQNGGTGESLPLLAPNMILRALAAEAGLAAPAAQPVPDAAARAAEAAGRYLTNRRAFSGPAQVVAALAPLTVTALPEGSLLIPTASMPAPSRFEPIAPDLWQDAQGDRVMLIRDSRGQILRLVDGTGASTHERLRGLDDPLWLWAAFALAMGLSLTTILGMLWRHGLHGVSRGGTLAASVALAGAVAVWVLVGAGAAAALAAARLGSEFLFDLPQPTLQAFLAIGSGTVVIAALIFLSLVFVWRTPEWSVWRRLHQTAFALSLVALASFMMQWGIAFGGPI